MVMVSHRRDAPRRARNTAGAQAPMWQAPLVWPLHLLPSFLVNSFAAAPHPAPALTRRQGTNGRNPHSSARVGSPNPGPNAGAAARSSRLCPAPLSRPIPGTDNRLAANEVQT